MLIQQQIAIFGWEIHDTYSILVVDMRGQNIDKTQFLVDHFSSTDEHKAIQYGDHIVCIFHISSKRDKTAVSQKIIRVLDKMDLKGALSKNFNDICDMDLYYRQALNILQFCRKKERDRSLFFKHHFQSFIGFPIVGKSPFHAVSWHFKMCFVPLRIGSFWGFKQSINTKVPAILYLCGNPGVFCAYDG